MTSRRDVQLSLAEVAEGFCPLCWVALTTHDDRACCPCGGCSYRLNSDRLEMGVCDAHPPRTCEHWVTIWQRIGHAKTTG